MNIESSNSNGFYLECSDVAVARVATETNRSVADVLAELATGAVVTSHYPSGGYLSLRDADLARAARAASKALIAKSRAADGYGRDY